MLDFKLINSLEENGYSVNDYLDDARSKEILDGKEITGRGIYRAEKLEKYLNEEGKDAEASIVAMMIDDIATSNGTAIKSNNDVEAIKLSEEEYKAWRKDLSASDDNYNKAGVEVINKESHSSNLTSYADDAEEDLQMDSDYEGGYTEVSGINGSRRQKLIFKKPSDLCKKAGLKSFKEFSEITGKSTSTLRDWFREDENLFEILLKGAVEHKRTKR